MKIDLYPCFKQWLRFDNIWISSDPHFGDEEMKHIRKNYIGDDQQVAKLNSRIGKKDLWICLGDVGDVNYVKKIRGYKVLIMGNHDKGATNYKRVREEVDAFDSSLMTPADAQRFAALGKQLMSGNKQVLAESKALMDKYTRKKVNDNFLFDEVYTGIVCINDKIVLSHEPVDIPFMMNIHGHTHNLSYDYDSAHLNCCAEAINYTPVSLSALYKQGKFANVESIHRKAIDFATSKKRNRGGAKRQG
jgi:calcineurin-like phosphoesterase family protein